MTTTAAPSRRHRRHRRGDALLSVTGLTKHFPIRRGLLQRQVGAVQAVDGLDFEVAPGRDLVARRRVRMRQDDDGAHVTRLIEPTDGTIELEGRDITHWSVGKLRPLRRDVQMIFQDPYGSLNPRHTVGTIVGAPFHLQGIKTEKGIKRHRPGPARARRPQPRALQPLPARVLGRPAPAHRHRPLARAQPKLIVADEPVSALDVSIQAQVINLLEDLQDELGLTYVVIAHDLSVVRHMSDRVAVMYLGKLVELAGRDDLYTRPMHPYTTALMSAVPIPDTPGARKRERIRLEGDVPSPIDPPPACRFHTRCWKAQEICKTQEPPLVELAPGHQVACHFPENIDSATASHPLPQTESGSEPPRDQAETL